MRGKRKREMEKKKSELEDRPYLGAQTIGLGRRARRRGAVAGSEIVKP